MTYRLSIDGHPALVALVARRPELRLRIDNGEHAVVARSLTDREFEILVDGVEARGWWHVAGGEVFIRLHGATYVLSLADEAALAAGHAGQHETIRADMPGTVVSVSCKAGDAVVAGDILLTVESMKLQMAIPAPHDATVERVHVEPNATFERGAELVSFAGAAEASR